MYMMGPDIINTLGFFQAHTHAFSLRRKIGESNIGI